MLRSEPRPTAEMLDELDRLDAALAAGGRDVPADGRTTPTDHRDGATDDRVRTADVRDDTADVRDGAAEDSDGTADDLDRELRALVTDVRATRPALDAGARMRLEERVQAAKAAPAPSRTPRLTADRRWRAGIALAAVVVVALPVGAVVRETGSDSETLSVSGRPMFGSGSSSTAEPSSDSSQSAESAAGSSSSARDSSASPDPSDVEQRSAEPQAQAAPAPAGSTAPAPAGSTAPGSSPSTPRAAPLGSARRVVRDVRQTVRIERGQVAAAAGRVTTIVQDAGGYLASSEVRERGSAAGGTFAVVVPTGRLDATVAALSRIGRPVRLSRSATDVTDQAVSLDDRLEDLRADRSAARLALARTVDPSRRAARRRELRLLSSRVAALQGERNALRRRTATSTIALRLTTTKTEEAAPLPVDDGRWGIGDAWRDAGRVLEVGGGVALVGGVVLLPLLLLGGLGVGLRRRALGRRREALIDRA